MIAIFWHCTSDFSTALPFYKTEMITFSSIPIFHWIWRKKIQNYDSLLQDCKFKTHRTSPTVERRNNKSLYEKDWWNKEKRIEESSMGCVDSSAHNSNNVSPAIVDPTTQGSSSDVLSLAAAKFVKATHALRQLQQNESHHFGIHPKLSTVRRLGMPR